MNKALLSCSLAFFALNSTAISAQESFFSVVASISKNLYKTSPEELYEILNISPISIPTIQATDLKKLMISNSDMLVVNVLPQKYYDDCHITGSINAPLPELVERAQNWDRSQKIVIYCALDECDAGEKGCILLSQMGFTNVSDYKGGIKEWFQLGYPTTGPALSEYLHTRGHVTTECEYQLYPSSIVCSRQLRWMSRYQNS